MKKVFGLLAVGLLLCSMTSCMSYYDKEEIGDALAELIPASMPLNEIYFGEGLPFADDEEEIRQFFDEFNLGTDATNYYPISESCEYQTVEDIKAATSAVFSEEYCDYLYTMAFQGISATFNEGTEYETKQTATFARYIEQSGILTKRVMDEDEIIKLNRTYDVNDFTIIINREEFVTTEVQSYIDGVKAERIEVTLVFTDSGWRLDSPTY